MNDHLDLSPILGESRRFVAVRRRAGVRQLASSGRPQPLENADAQIATIEPFRNSADKWKDGAPAYCNRALER